MKTLNLDDPKEAREFIKKCIQPLLKEIAGSHATELHLADGSIRNISDLDDSEVIQYAKELLPMYQARYPQNVKLEYEQ